MKYLILQTFEKQYFYIFILVYKYLIVNLPLSFCRTCVHNSNKIHIYVDKIHKQVILLHTLSYERNKIKAPSHQRGHKSAIFLFAIIFYILDNNICCRCFLIRIMTHLETLLNAFHRPNKTRHLFWSQIIS